MRDATDRARRDYFKARVDNIKSQVTIYDVLNYYHVPIQTENAEVQYPCPLHGDGKDNGFSARVYPDEDGNGGSTYCWGCQKARDVVGWTMDKESLSFGQALRYLEATYSVRNIPVMERFFDPSYVELEEIKPKIPSFLNELETIFNEETELDFSYLERKIKRLVETRKERLPMETVLKLYYAFDSLQFDLKEKNVSREKALEMHHKLSSIISKLGQDV